VSTGFPNRCDCDRARELASRHLDGDLTEFDLGALRTHLRECPDCAEAAAGMERVTDRIRAAARLEPAPARPMVVSAGRRPRSSHRLIAAAVAVAAAASAAGAGAIVASHAHRTATQPSQPTTLAELAPLDHQFRSIREGKLLLVLPAPQVRSPHRRGVLV
jgi:ferric-dicitrate binding protein FerR (iron transport regulator)